MTGIFSQALQAIVTSRPLIRLQEAALSSRYPLRVFLASRACLFLCVYLSLVVIPVREGEGFWRAAADNLFLDGFVRADAGWYLEIAKHGYSDIGGAGAQKNTAFFPALPLLLSIAIAHGERIAILWGLAITNLLFCIGLCFTFAISRELMGEKVARLSVAILAFGPFSFFFSCIYTESLFLASTAASFWLARKGCAWASMTAAAIASITRVVGFLCIPFAFLVCLSSTRNLSPKHTIMDSTAIFKHLPSLIFAIMPLTIHLTYLNVSFGSPLKFVSSQQGWSSLSSVEVLANSWRPLAHLELGAIGSGDLQIMNIINSAALAATAACLILAILRKMLPFYLLAWALLTIVASSSVWTSGLRFASAIFPVSIVAAIFCRRLQPELVIACSGMMMGTFAIAFSHWYWVA